MGTFAHFMTNITSALKVSSKVNIYNMYIYEYKI